MPKVMDFTAAQMLLTTPYWIYPDVEYSGIAIAANNETNGITFGGVGNGTVVENVQVDFCGDDAFEWFGGTVNCKNLIAYRALDDDFDCDFGFRGMPKRINMTTLW